MMMPMILKASDRIFVNNVQYEIVDVERYNDAMSTCILRSMDGLNLECRIDVFPPSHGNNPTSDGS